MRQIRALDDADFSSICTQIDKERAERQLPQILVSVRQLGGAHLLGPQLIPASTTVLRLTQLLASSIGAEPEEIDLLCKTQVLHPTDTLASLGEQFEGALDMVRRPRRTKLLQHRLPRVFVASLGTQGDVLVVPGATAWSDDTIVQPDEASQAMLEQLNVPEATFRRWNPFRSHIAAAMIGGVGTTPSWKGERVLVLAMDASAMNLSFYADLVGEGGAVSFISRAPIAADSLRKLKQHWPNVQELVDLPDTGWSHGNRIQACQSAIKQSSEEIWLIIATATAA